VPLPQTSSELTLHALWEMAKKELGGDVTLEFSRDVIHKLACPTCNAEEELFAPVGTVKYERGKCPQDESMRVVITAHGYSGQEDYGERTLSALGLPLFDVITARSSDGDREIAYLVAGDAASVLGILA
jgi:hypothetical protein